MNWEYKTIKPWQSVKWGGKLDETRLDSLMNDLGQQGWELATALDVEKARFSITREVVLIFKRPRA